jgi:hypothetical protein
VKPASNSRRFILIQLLTILSPERSRTTFTQILYQYMMDTIPSEVRQCLRTDASIPQLTLLGTSYNTHAVRTSWVAFDGEDMFVFLKVRRSLILFLTQFYLLPLLQCIVRFLIGLFNRPSLDLKQSCKRRASTFRYKLSVIMLPHLYLGLWPWGVMNLVALHHISSFATSFKPLKLLQTIHK